MFDPIEVVRQKLVSGGDTLEDTSGSEALSHIAELVEAAKRHDHGRYNRSCRICLALQPFTGENDDC